MKLPFLRCSFVFSSMMFSWHLLMASLPADGGEDLLLHLSSGKQVAFKLYECPVITFVDDELVFSTYMSEVRYRAADVRKFTYASSGLEGIDGTVLPQPMISFVGNILKVSGLENASTISVYTMNGLLVASAEASQEGVATLLLPEQIGVVYVVNTPFANFKVTKL